MADSGDYRMRIEPRASGSPKYRVTVTLHDRVVGEDYTSSFTRAEELGHRMIQRHQQLFKTQKRLLA